MSKRVMEFQKIETENVVNFLKENGAGSIILRTDIEKVSCGFLKAGSVANDDCRGNGPKKRVVFGPKGRIGYPIQNLAEYMVRRGFRIETSS